MSYGTVMTMRKRPEVIQPVYNDGLVTLIEFTQAVDEYGTPIGGLKPKIINQHWYRDISLTASDTYYAHADDTELSSKIAIRGKVKINIKWVAEIDNVEHEIYRTYYNPKKNETEISLKEVQS